MSHHSGLPLGLCLLAGCGKWHLFPFPLCSHACTPPVEDKKVRALELRETLVHPHPRYKVQVWSPIASEGPGGAGARSICNYRGDGAAV